MAPGPPKLPRINLPTNPLEPLQGIVREGRERIEKAGSDIRSVADELHGFGSSESTTPATAPIAQKEAPSEQKTTPTITQEPETSPRKEAIATACVPCCLGHFSTSAGLLNEAVRFKGEGIASNEILDRIAKVLEEQNTLERVDLTQEKIRGTPEWERELAEEALQQSRSLRHRLETLTTIKELKEAAADTEGYYRDLNRKWWKLRLTKTGKTEPELTLEDAKKMAAEEAEKEVEKRWKEEKSAT